MKKVNVPGGYSYDIPVTIEEAQNLAKKTRIKDPFQNENEDKISPSLLNKHDIIRYVSKTGMIFPFDPNQLKSASYQVPVGNEYIRWTKGKRGKRSKEHKTHLAKNKKIPLEKNSITFVDVDATFYLPYYIALRFNLTITHVHRGILLGTGPLIDPGFNGKIMIPIHNLTNNDYYLKPGEDLIAIEFTKLTPDKILSLDCKDIEEWYKTNIKKDHPTFSDYLSHALPHGVNLVESSIGKYIDDAETRLKKIRRYTNFVYTGAIIAIAAVIISAVCAYLQVQDTVSTVNKYISETENQLDSKIQDLTVRINTLSEQVNKEAPEKAEANQMNEIGE